MASSEVMDVALNHGSPLSLVAHVAMGAARKVHGASVSHEAAGIRSYEGCMAPRVKRGGRKRRTGGEGGGLGGGGYSYLGSRVRERSPRSLGRSAVMRG